MVFKEKKYRCQADLKICSLSGWTT